MIKEIVQIGATVAAVLAAASIAVPQAHAADTVGTYIYSPTPQLYQPFEMQMHLKPAMIKMIHADIQKMHTITCTLTGGTTDNDMAMLQCRPGS